MTPPAGFDPRQAKPKLDHNMNNIRLRNKRTGLYYVEGKHFSGTESEASIYEFNSPCHLVIKYTYGPENMEVVEVSSLRRVTMRRDGIEKIEKISFGNTGRNIYGESARGHWVVKGYKKNGLFKRSLLELKAALNATTAQ